MKARALSDVAKATLLVWAAGATLAGACYLALDPPNRLLPLAWDGRSPSSPTVSGLTRPTPPRRVVTRTRAS